MKTLHMHTVVGTLKALALSAVLIVALLGFVGTQSAQAYVIEDTGMELTGSFLLENAKIEVDLDPGESIIKEVIVTNRSENVIHFTIDLEDFKGSATDAGTAVDLLGSERGPYSLKDYFNPEVSEFTLEPGQRIKLPVEISIPADAEPGGLYGSVVIAASPRGGGQNPMITRLAALFFVRVGGYVEHDGHLESIELIPNKKVFTNDAPKQFVLTSRNDGSVHLNAYGVVSITNSLGVTIDEIEIPPYFVMPASIRSRTLDWTADLLLGRYTATAYINRGYDDIIDEASVSFWIIPWMLIVKSFVGIVLLVALARWILSNFEIKTKKSSRRPRK